MQWEPDAGFWDDDMHVPPVVDAEPEDPALTSLKRALADAKARHNPKLAATLQQAITSFTPDVPPSSQAAGTLGSTTETRKNHHDLAGDHVG